MAPAAGGRRMIMLSECDDYPYDLRYGCLFNIMSTNNNRHRR